MHGAPVEHVYASTAVRARRTAEIIGAALGTEVTCLPALVEAGADADVLRSWVVDSDLTRRAADGESGADVVVRTTHTLAALADAHEGATAVVVGHVASLTVGVSVLCRLGAGLWGRPLTFATPVTLARIDGRWSCVDWPG